MDNRDEVREFLTSRRAKITPEQAGLPAGSRRRVPGLRRSEVAALADVSVEYYAKLERGNLSGASPAVLEAVAGALRLDDAERTHLLHLARPKKAPTRLPAHGRARPGSGPCTRACDGPWTPSPPGRRSSSTAGWTCSPPTNSAAPSSATSTRAA
ncbi:hypothetical protein SNL152K_1812 [Streptomyces sp. NL15-2K]|nr:helix-turn-helix transcriptional regulator [Kutzneria buriramensis]WKX14410.1 helix-turn-helix transcriptional regulator [Kutzneria buriramensis]GCB44522.1 hypothetical protein SNL152K_1812 [Streptomyces sp. NL15-2K]